MTLKCLPCMRETWAERSGEATLAEAERNMDAFPDAVTVADGVALCLHHALSKPQGGWVFGV